MKKLLLTTIICLLVSTTGLAKDAVDLKIGYVHMNKVINTSNEGKRKKKLLEAQARQSQKLLKMKEDELRAKERDLKENIMLNEEAKANKQAEINQLVKELREEVAKAQNSFRKDEARHTANIFKDLVKIVEKIAADEKFDLILEYNVIQAIIYSKYNMIDITDKVTAEYNKIQSLQQ